MVRMNQSYKQLFCQQNDNVIKLKCINIERDCKKVVLYEAIHMTVNDGGKVRFSFTTH